VQLLSGHPVKQAHEQPKSIVSSFSLILIWTKDIRKNLPSGNLYLLI